MTDSQNKPGSNFQHSGLPSIAIRRPVATLSLTAVILVLGLLFSGRLPVDLLPQADYPHIRVVVNYPGVTPEVIEEQVTRPLERNLAATENLTELHGRASEGRSYIEMFFDYETDIDIALQDASRQLERARTELPDGIDPPRIMKMDPSQDPVFELAISSPVRDPIEVRDWVDQQLAPQLLSVPGVGTIDIGGGKEREMDVVLDPERLRSYRLNLPDISELLEGRSVDRAAGNITSPDYDIMGRIETRYRTEDDVRNTRVNIGGMNRRISLSDIADISDSHREQRLFARLNGDDAVQISIMKQPLANTSATIANVKSQLEELRASGFITPDLEYHVIRDESFFIDASLRSVSIAAIIGGLLAISVILFFIGSIRRSFIVILSLPVAVIATFLLMAMSGLTLNVMSLGGLALGVGLLIDNSIVMLENIFRRQNEEGDSAVQAAHNGAKEVISAVTAGTLTNLAAVLPFLLVTGLAALLFRELILTISFAILASLLAAVTLVPTLSAQFAGRSGNSGLSRSLPVRLFHSGFLRVRNHYTTSLKWLIRRRFWLITFALILLGGSIYIIRGLGTEFLPPVDDGRITMRFVLPAGTSVDPTYEASEIIEDAIRDMPHVETVYMTVGGYFRGGQLSIRGGMIDITVQLVPLSERRGYSGERWASEFSEKTDEMGLPFVQERIRGPRLPGIQTGLLDADIAIGVVGQDLDVLETEARGIFRQLEGIEGLGSIQIGREGQIPQLMIRVDEERAADHGMSQNEVADLLNSAVEGVVPTHFVEGGFEYNVRVRFPRSVTGSTDGLSRIPVFNTDGQSVPLGALASFEETTGPAHIERFNQIRVVWVNTTVNMEEATVGEVADRIRNQLEDIDLPDGYSLIYGGEQEAIEESERSLMLAIALAIFFVFVVMAVQYEKLSSPLVILTTLPFALIGVGFMLWITGLSLSAPVLLGLVFLTGIIVNNAILLVEFIETNRVTMGVEDSVIRAGEIRFRPIMMTTMTTIFGMLPLALGIGEGSELLQPLAVTVIGGLLIGSLLTLLLLPGVYVIAADLRNIFKK
ncbi:efflux RND transporter permease subunit [Natronogracilivirga saccharolytica]|uniref:Efflux RND transporter permease subunit n=1 Tax=Natronogracilivirga saccharolytica TaxID=2812953 RepID=A0A8J7RQ22_9BACT|nr:efflux RND transporter permease subunit [Natronogracilivirga saccharolytica]MBP3191804.1 efflux RND transporter permease subunit [Natronogracilivirga saccharolytica]